MEEGFTVFYVGWLLLKVCSIVVYCLFFPPPEQAKVTHP